MEFACGTGTQVIAIDPYVEETYGIELSHNRIELTFERGKRMGAGTDFIMGDMFSLPFGSNAVSTSFNSGVFHHFEDGAVRQLADEICRVTSDYVVLSVSNEWYPKGRGEPSRRMKSHEYWAQLFSSHDALELVEDGEYGNRLDALYRGVTETRPFWLIRWLKAGLPYHRSWYVFAVSD